MWYFILRMCANCLKIHSNHDILSRSSLHLNVRRHKKANTILNTFFWKTESLMCFCVWAVNVNTFSDAKWRIIRKISFDRRSVLTSIEREERKIKKKLDYKFSILVTFFICYGFFVYRKDLSQLMSKSHFLRITFFTMCHFSGKDQERQK